MNHLPTVNAALNFTSAVLLALGFFFIRRKAIVAHKTCMIAAFLTSTLFLVGYITYHLARGVIRFQGQGTIRPVYFTILSTHTVLAAAIPPLAIITLWRAWRGRFDRHKRIARWTLPIWLYVSVTGVVIYFMLYHYSSAFMR